MSNEEYHVASRFESSRTSLLWRLHCFTLCNFSKKTYSSPEFGEKSRWQLHINTDAKLSTLGEKLHTLSCTLQLISKPEEKVSSRIGLRDRNGKDRFVLRNNFTFHSGKTETDILTIFEKLKLSDVKELLSDDTLTVFCELMGECSIENLSIVKRKGDCGESVYVSDNCMEELVTDLKHLLTGKDYSDVVLKSSDQQEFSAHRNILHARSPVFSVMFQLNMVEKMSGLVNIEDIDGETLQSFLSYIYTNKVQVTSQEAAWRLYAAANKYQMQGLKQLCVNHITRYLTMDNACDSVLLAQNYGEENLSKLAMQMIRKKAQIVLASKSWMKLVRNDVVLASEILHEIFANYKENL